MITTVKRWVVGAALGVLAILAAVFAGRRQGRQAQQNKDLAKAAQAQRQGMEARRDAKQEVNRLPDGGAADELKRDWMRD